MRHTFTASLSITLGLLVAASAIAQDNADMPETLNTAASEAAAVEPADNAPAAKGLPAVQEDSDLTIRVAPVQTTVVNLNREDWPSRTTGPADGRVVHHPTYVLEATYWGDEVNPLSPTQVESQLEEALSSATAANWSWGNLGDAAAAPLFAAGELVVLPVSAIISPPWIAVETPPASDDDTEDSSSIE